MKKIYVLFFVVLAIACSGGDDNGASAFTSSITINGAKFRPLASETTTSIQYNVNGNAANLRKFTMIDAQGRSIYVSVHYPVAQTSVNGEYTFNSVNPNNRAKVEYNIDSAHYETYASGTLAVTEMGDDKFKLTFNNVAVSDTQIIITLIGTAEGTFIE